ncbi:MAG: KTSC domain-containing protein [Hyphomicrobium sp.]
MSEIGYREDAKEMTVAWLKGRRSVYSGVPEETALQVANAPSVGSMLNTDIKPYYSHRYE